MALILSVAALAAVLGFALRRPRGWPEIVVALPAAGLLLAVGATTWQSARTEVTDLLPVVGFLAAVLVLALVADLLLVPALVRVGWMDFERSGPSPSPSEEVR